MDEGVAVATKTVVVAPEVVALVSSALFKSTDAVPERATLLLELDEPATILNGKEYWKVDGEESRVSLNP